MAFFPFRPAYCPAKLSRGPETIKLRLCDRKRVCVAARWLVTRASVRSEAAQSCAALYTGPQISFMATCIFCSGANRGKPCCKRGAIIRCASSIVKDRGLSGVDMDFVVVAHQLHSCPASRRTTACGVAATSGTLPEADVNPSADWRSDGSQPNVPIISVPFGAHPRFGCFTVFTKQWRSAKMPCEQ